jgi:ABC-2 type transport system permease protein
MTTLARLYRVNLRLGVAVWLQSRAALAIYLAGAASQPLVLLIVWMAVARSGDGAVGGYGGADFAAYFLVAMVVNRATLTWVGEHVEEWVRLGRLSPLLLRPVHPVHGVVADIAACNGVALLAVVPAALALALVFRPALGPAPWQVAAFGPALLLAAALRFATDWAVATLAFWTTRMGAVGAAHRTIILFCAGNLAPLALFPAPFRTLTLFLPYRWMVAFPIELLLGRLTPGETLAGFAAQGLWLAIGAAAGRRLWGAGLRRYTGVGL